MDPVLVFIALVTIVSAGFGPAMFFLRRSNSVSVVELLAFSWLLGVSSLSLSLVCCGILIRGLTLQMTVAAGCVISGCLGVRLLRANKDKISWPKPVGKIEAGLCAILLFQFAAALLIQYRTALGWDGLLTWEIKARYAFLNGGSIPLEYFSDPTRTFSTPNYPLMLPMLETWIYLWIGDCDQFWVRFVFPVFYYAAALVLYLGVAHLSGKKWIGLTAAVMLMFIPFPAAGAWNVFAGYADLPLAVFYLAALVCFLRYQIEPSGIRLILLSLVAGMLPWVKREGIVLWACLMTVVLVELVRRRKFFAAVQMLIPGAVVCIGWKIARVIMDTSPVTDFHSCSLEFLERNLPRALTALRMLFVELANPGDWSLLWYVFPAALVCLFFNGRKKIAMQLFFCVAAPLFLLSCSFVLSSWPDFQNHIRTSLPRLILQVAPLAMLAMGLAMGVRPEAGGRPWRNQ